MGRKKFSTIEEANSNLSEFQSKLKSLRDEYGAFDIIFACRVEVEGLSGCPMIYGYYGDFFNMEALTAFAFGQASAERQEHVMEMMNAGKQAINAGNKSK